VIPSQKTYLTKVDKIIQNIDLTDIEKNYEGEGHPPISKLSSSC